jgi:ribosomal protein S17
MMYKSVMSISDITIPSRIAHSVPRECKINEVSKYLEEHGELDEPIVVDKNGILRDGYIRYLVAAGAGLESVNVIVTEDNYEYIVGRFLQRSKKEYHWCNLAGLKISVGDIVRVRNGKGYANVVVVKTYRDKWLGHKIVKSVIKHK